MVAVYNGIDTSKFSSRRSDIIEIRRNLGYSTHEIVLLAVGRFAAAKDYPNLLIAFEKALRLNSRLRLMIAGDGEGRHEIESLVRALDIGNYVQLLGVRTDVARLYNACDIYVLSSAWEGFGLVVAEAMATECIVIATDCGGVKEVLGTCGFLIPPNNSKVLSEAIIEAVELPVNSAVSMRLMARDRILMNYTLDLILDKWQHIYSNA